MKVYNLTLCLLPDPPTQWIIQAPILLWNNLTDFLLWKKAVNRPVIDRHSQFFSGFVKCRFGGSCKS